MACCTQPPSALQTLSLPEVAYEREAGAASRPLPLGAYRRHEPEKTVLYQVVRQHLETLLADARERSPSGAGYPAFVEAELRRYLDCGMLARGFARLRCPGCGKHERLVAFSCQGRLCPSCTARRAADTAAHLVDRLLPAVPYRQVVLSYPWRLRLLLAYDPAFESLMQRTFLRTVFVWQRRRGRSLGIAGGQTGAVAFLQRFGGILNLNPHIHAVTPDGLFVPVPDGPMTFLPLPPPTDDDIARLTARVVERLTPLANERAALAEQQFEDVDDEQAVVVASAAEAVRAPLAATSRDRHADPAPRPLCARIDGFSLHAARRVEAHDRAGLEQLCRYGLRAPLALDRLSLDSDGRVRYRLLRPWPGPDGKTEIVLDPLAFLRRLAALVPAPYHNMTRYHGVFASRSRWRSRLPPPVAVDVETQIPLPLPAAARADPGGHQSGSAADPAQRPAGPTDVAHAHCPTDDCAAHRGSHRADGSQGQALAGIRPRRLPWAKLLKRTLGVDALQCPQCLTPMVVLAFITKPDVVRRILDHLHLPSAMPPIAPARLPHDDFYPDVCPDLTPDEQPEDIDHRCNGRSRCCASSRAPPTWRRTGT